MSDPSKVRITQGAQIPTLGEVKNNLRKYYPNVQTGKKYSFKGTSTFTVYKANYVETNAKAFVVEHGNGKFYMHSGKAELGIISMSGQNNKTDKMGVIDENGRFFWAEDKNSNQKIDSGEAFYYRKENSKDILGEKTMLF